jgi:hypothetical protein
MMVSISRCAERPVRSATDRGFPLPAVTPAEGTARLLGRQLACCNKLRVPLIGRGGRGSNSSRVGKRSSRVAHNHEIAGSNPAPATSSLFVQACGPP